MQQQGRRYIKLFIPLAALSLAWMLLGLIVDGPEVVAEGLRTILFTQDQLYTDYMATAGMGAAFVNAGLVCLLSLAILYFAGDPVNGFTMVTMGLMAGFSLFGKNLVNITPILLGGFLYSRIKREPFGKYTSVTLLATALSPAVSYLAFRPEGHRPILGVLVGVLIGFVVPSLAAYTFRIQNGMNLYNAGFACGILGMVLVPVLNANDLGPATVLFWSEEHTLPIGVGVCALCAALILAGTLYGRRGAWARYGKLLRTTGRLPSDYLRAFGLSTVCINMGINGLLGVAYILAVGGDLNGPTVGAILTVMGFSAYGKHARNILPVIAGVFLGDLINNVPLDNPSMQIAGLFGTTLAPIAGVFGWPFGILAGFLHSSVVLYSGAAMGGLNLYNNGFAGGLVAVVLYPVLTGLLHPKWFAHHDEEFYDIFEEDQPIDEEELGVHMDDERAPLGSEDPEDGEESSE